MLQLSLYTRLSNSIEGRRSVKSSCLIKGTPWSRRTAICTFIFEWECDDCDYHSNNGADDGFDNPPGFLKGLLELRPHGTRPQPNPGFDLTTVPRPGSAFRGAPEAGPSRTPVDPPEVPLVPSPLTPSRAGDREVRARLPPHEARRADPQRSCAGAGSRSSRGTTRPTGAR